MSLSEIKTPKFGFDMTFKTCFKSNDDKKERHIIAIASDTLEDNHNEVVSEQGILSMVNSVKKGITRGTIDNHRSTFAFGDIVDGSITKNPIDPTIYEFMIDILLKDHYPQSQDLWNSVEKGDDKYQLSIGGFMNPDNPKAVSYVTKDDGTIVKSLDDLILDHVMVTARNHAANPRTRFIQSIAKSFHDMDNDNMDKAIFVKHSDAAGFSKATFPELKIAIEKMNFKTMPDHYDGHIHLIKSLDENGNGLSEESVGLHPRSESHKHEIKGWVVQDLELDVVDHGDSKESEYEWNSTHNTAYAGMEQGKFKSKHKNLDMSCAYMIVGKDKEQSNQSVAKTSKIDSAEKTDSLTKTAFMSSIEKRAALPNEAFAIPELKRLPHHRLNVKKGSEHNTIDITALKSSLQAIDDPKFLSNLNLSVDLVNSYKEAARRHLNEHLTVVNKCLEKSNSKKSLIQKFKSLFIKKDNKMGLKVDQKRAKELSDMFARLAESKDESVEVTESDINTYLSAKEDIDSLLAELNLDGEPELPVVPPTAKVEVTPAVTAPVVTSTTVAPEVVANSNQNLDIVKSIQDMNTALISQMAAMKTQVDKELSAMSAKLAKLDSTPVGKSTPNVESDDDSFLKSIFGDEPSEDEVNTDSLFGFLGPAVDHAAGQKAFRGNRSKK